MDINIWAIAIENQLFRRGSYTQINFFKKNEEVSGKSLIFVIGTFCTYHSICLNPLIPGGNSCRFV